MRRTNKADKQRNEIYVVGAVRVGIHGVSPVPGARIADCQRCGAAVWVSPSSESRLRVGFALQCIECCKADLKALEDSDVVIENLSPTHVQFNEIIEALEE